MTAGITLTLALSQRERECFLALPNRILRGSRTIPLSRGERDGVRGGVVSIASFRPWARLRVRRSVNCIITAKRL